MPTSRWLPPGAPPLTGSHVSSATVVVDVGTNVLPDGSLVGDVDAASVTERGGGTNPGARGVGSVTTAAAVPASRGGGTPPIGFLPPPAPLR